jgi:hypothetical protein
VKAVTYFRIKIHRRAPHARRFQSRPSSYHMLS